MLQPDPIYATMPPSDMVGGMVMAAKAYQRRDTGRWVVYLYWGGRNWKRTRYIEVIRNLLGHSDIKMTQRYAHVEAAGIRRVLER